MKFVSVLFVLATVPFASLADSGPERAPAKPTPSFIATDALRLESAHVRVRIDARQRLVDRVTGKRQYVATVVCFFHVSQTKEARGKGEPRIGFAVHSPKAGQPKIESFRVDDHEMVEKKHPVSLVQKGGHTEPLTGFTWVPPLPAWEPTTIRVSYRMVLDSKDREAVFEYILRSGALWAGTVKRESVHITAAEGLAMNLQMPKGLVPDKASPRSILFDLKSIDPKEDIVLTVKPTKS